MPIAMVSQPRNRDERILVKCVSYMNESLAFDCEGPEYEIVRSMFRNDGPWNVVLKPLCLPDTMFSFTYRKVGEPIEVQLYTASDYKFYENLDQL
jgi:hypothetical protein